jgi:hypothetical protein
MKRVVPGVGYDVYETGDTVSLVIPQVKPDAKQFECTVNKDKNGNLWMNVEPGFVKILNYNNLLITSTGNRDVSVGDASVITSTPLAVTKLYKVDGCNCYKALRYPTKAATLALNQFQLETEEDSLVVLYRAAPGYGKPRLAVISVSLFNSCFRYGPTSATDGEGSVPIIKHLFQLTSAQYTVDTTIPGIPPTHAAGLTDYIPFLGLKYSLWDRLGIYVKFIALYDSTTKKLTQYHTGDVDLTETAESYISSTGPFVTTGPCIDDGWASSFYVTSGTGAPSGYTFDYSV